MASTVDSNIEEMTYTSVVQGLCGKGNRTKSRAHGGDLGASEDSTLAWHWWALDWSCGGFGGLSVRGIASATVPGRSTEKAEENGSCHIASERIKFLAS